MMTQAELEVPFRRCRASVEVLLFKVVLSGPKPTLNRDRHASASFRRLRTDQ